MGNILALLFKKLGGEMASLSHKARNDSEYCIHTLQDEERERAKVVQKHFYRPPINLDLSAGEIIVWGIVGLFWSVIFTAFVIGFLSLQP